MKIQKKIVNDNEFVLLDFSRYYLIIVYYIFMYEKCRDTCCRSKESERLSNDLYLYSWRHRGGWRRVVQSSIKIIYSCISRLR